MCQQKYNEFINQLVVKNGKPQYDFSHKRMNRIEGFHIHHIVPTSLGGTDESSNLVYVTTEEHITAHRLLSNYAGPKMVLAYKLMTNQNYDALSEYFNTPNVRQHRSEKAKNQHKQMSERDRISRGRNISKGYKLWSDERRYQFGQEISKRKKKAVVGVCISTGNVIEFDSGKDTAKMGFRPSKVSECCNKRCDSHMGYVWSFKEQ